MKTDKIVLIEHKEGEERTKASGQFEVEGSLENHGCLDQITAHAIFSETSLEGV